MKEHQRIQNIGSENYSGKKILFSEMGVLVRVQPEVQIKIIKIMERKQLWISCDCHDEVMLLTHDISSGSVPYNEFYISIYRYSYAKKPNLWRRLKYCWYHLTTGKKYEDQMILSSKTAKEMSDWINNRLNQKS